MEIILNRNNGKPRIELSCELVNKMDVKRGDYLLIYKEAGTFDFGFLKLHGEDAKAIDGAKIKKRKGVLYINPTTPPLDYIFAAYRVSKTLTLDIEEKKVKEDPLFLWKRKEDLEH